MATERGVLICCRGSLVSERGDDGIEDLEGGVAVRVRGPVDEPAGDYLNYLPQSVIYSWRRLVLFCFHARRVYGKTGKTTFAFLDVRCG